MQGCIVVIPARYASSRFPGKPLACIAGRPMIQHVSERASQARLHAAVFVTTDYRRIAAAVVESRRRVVITSPTQPLATNR